MIVPAQILDALELGADRYDAAVAAGISVAILRAKLESDAQFRFEIEAAEARGRIARQQTIVTLSQRDTRAAIWLLERARRDVDLRRAEIELAKEQIKFTQLEQLASDPETW